MAGALAVTDPWTLALFVHQDKSISFCSIYRCLLALLRKMYSDYLIALQESASSLCRACRCFQGQYSSQ